MAKLCHLIIEKFATSIKIIVFILADLYLNKDEIIYSPASTKIQNLMVHFFEFTKKFKRPKYLVIICLLFSLSLSMVTYKNPTYEPNNILYFLSSISQGLAAIFTLLFTITIFAVQMNKTYTSIDKIFDKWTLLLMMLFGVGIILPLIQLVINHNYLPFDRIKNLSLAVDLFLASFCILSIIPYSIKINKTMLYKSGLSNLSNDISEAISLDNKAVVSIKVNELIKLCDISLDDRQWDEAYSIVDELKNIPEKISSSEWTDLNLSIIKELVKVSYQNQFKKTMLTVKVIEALGTIGSKDRILLLDKDQVELKLKGPSLFKAKDSFMLFNYYYILQRNWTLALIYLWKRIFHFGPRDNLFYLFVAKKNKMEKTKFQTEFPIDIREFNQIFNSYQRFEYFRNFYEDIKKRNGLILPEIHFWEDKIDDDLIIPEVFKSENFLSLSRRTIMGLYEIGFKLSFESQHHIQEIDQVLIQLEKIGVNAVNSNLKNCIVTMCSYCIYEITALSIQVGKEDKNKKLLLSAMEHLVTIAYKTYEKDKNQFEDSCKTSLAFWWILGAYANKYLPNYTNEIISKLKKSNNGIIKENLRIESVLTDVREYLIPYKECIENLNTFENLYNMAD